MSACHTLGNGQLTNDIADIMVELNRLIPAGIGRDHRVVIERRYGRNRLRRWKITGACGFAQDSRMGVLPSRPIVANGGMEHGVCEGHASPEPHIHRLCRPRQRHRPTWAWSPKRSPSSPSSPTTTTRSSCVPLNQHRACVGSNWCRPSTVMPVCRLGPGTSWLVAVLRS
jgi:hypothetical protein